MKEILTHIQGIPIQRNFVENLPFNPHLTVLLKEKRKARILSEVIFWKKVRAGAFHHIDFDRQRIIGNYIVDFYVKTLGLIVEIDGSSHDEKQVYDGIRQEYLESLGLLVFRTTDFDVRNNIYVVMKDLECFIIQYFGTTPSSKIL
ncbi:endonuclease domain-containing protein [Chryseobacterium sp. OSA05B]|uniref:endonuclease domain-containing protein n=1 Tax=Chryseobacterium sp. OSA05B TaxID=2862650 RepID=UPI001CBF0DD2|nr:endonuclease domain-containing protein [Chryseobacterium sp. OSA05B]